MGPWNPPHICLVHGSMLSVTPAPISTTFWPSQVMIKVIHHSIITNILWVWPHWPSVHSKAVYPSWLLTSSIHRSTSRLYTYPSLMTTLSLMHSVQLLDIFSRAFNLSDPPIPFLTFAFPRLSMSHSHNFETLNYISSSTSTNRNVLWV